ncbi:hemicentin-1-like [Callorhinchus milii]|uniref:hemicentin-1-like n=1 Tax=Callorhinchus milii TaxID=7868 RepID=UPI001C3FA680|nr:hemicentin-1-like [Callorhinchus milii]
MDRNLFSSVGVLCFFGSLISVWSLPANGTEFNTWIDLSSQAVEFGEFVKINCSTTCGRPEPFIQFELKEKPKNIIGGPTWKAFSYSSVQFWDNPIICLVTCGSNASFTSLVLPVYNRELNITQPSGALQEKKQYSLECTGPRVYPKDRLILKWLKGDEILHTAFTNVPGMPDEDNRLRNVLNITANKSDDGQNYTCVAEIILESNNTMQIQTSSVTLQVNYAPTVGINKASEDWVEGKPQTVSCDVTGSPAPRLTWTKDGKPLSRERTLHIQSVHMDDAGLYTCTATNKYGSTNYSLNVTIMYAPTVDINKASEDWVEGKPQTVSCDVTGSPAPRLTWTKDGKHLSREKTLHIQSVHMDDAGLYTCTATNKYGSTNSSLNVTIMYAPTVGINKSSEDWVEGKPQTVSCDVTGSPAPRLTWTKDGKPLSREKTLHIQSVHMDDAGLYTCTATNKYGSTNYSLNVTIMYAPTVDINKASEDWVEGKPQTVSCDVTGSPAPRLTWTKDGKPLSREKTLHIQSVHMDDAGLYTCTATNKYGSTNFSLNVTIMYAPTVGINKASEDWVEGKPQTVSCDVTGSPAPRLTWTKDGKPLSREKTLHIQSVHMDDAGLYTCTATNKYGSTNSSLNVTIMYAPTVDINKASEDWVEGKPQTVSCDVTGSPAPRLTWTKDGKPLSRERTLHIQSVHMDDAGLYTCTATNKYGSTNYSLNVTIMYAPTVDINKASEDWVEGKPQTVSCDVTGSPAPRLTWNKDGKPLSREKTLHIQSVHMDDAGLYTCTATNEYGSTNYSLNVTIMYAPTVDINKASEDWVEGKPQTVSCDVTGSPAPRLTWSKDGKPLSREKTLHIQSVHMDDAGLYTCTATNKYGSTNYSLNVTIMYAPTVDINKASEDWVEGKPQTVSCDVTGSPAPRLTWTKDGKPLSRERTLHIQSVHMDDAGLYTCTATNKYGSTNYSLNVTIMYAPTVDINKASEDWVEGKPQTVSCDVTGSPAPRLTWTKDGKHLSRERTLHIQSVHMDDAGLYTCTATNEYGSTNYSLNVTIMYAPTVDINKASEDWVEGKPQTVSCDVTGSPAPRLTWTKDGKHLSRERTLHIQSVHMDDAGLYTCTATNKYGSTNYSLNVTIMYKPRNTTISINKTKRTPESPIQINNGDNVTLTCFSEANPSANLSWEYPHQSTNVKEYPSGILFISYANSGNSGIYKCRANNHHGTDVQKVEISVNGIQVIHLLAISLFLVVALLLLLLGMVYYFSKIYRTGAYEVRPSNPNYSLYVITPSV